MLIARLHTATIPAGDGFSGLLRSVLVAAALLLGSHTLSGPASNVFGIRFTNAQMAASTSDSAERPADTTSWSNVQTVLENKCVRCHGDQRAARGLRLDSWEHLIQGSDFGSAVIPFDTGNSLMVGLADKYRAGSHPEELGEPALTESEIGRLKSWVEAGAPDLNGAIPFDNDEPRLYVANQGAASVSVIDISTNQVIRTVDLTELGFTPGAMPHHIVVEPGGSHWYVSLIVDNAVLKFDRQNRLVGRASVERPGLLALNPEEPWLYAGRSMISVSPPQSVARIDKRDMSVEEIELLMPRPHALEVSPDGRFTYVSSLSMNRIATIDNREDDISFSDVDGSMPHVFIGFRISPSGDRMVATSEVTSKLFVADLTDPSTPVITDTVSVGRAPWHPVFTPDGTSAYFGNNWTNTVTVVDMDSLQPEVIEGRGLAQPHGAAVSPDGAYVYISSRNLAMPEGHSKEEHVYVPRYDLGDNAHVGTVVVIDTATREIVKVIETDAYAAGMGVAARTVSEKPPSEKAGVNGQVRFEGDPPDPLRLLITKDIEICGSGYRERKEVDVARDGGLRNVVVFLEDDPGGTKTWEDVESDPIVDQQDCSFQPHIQIVPRRGEVEIVNSDSTLHNIHAYELIGRARRSLFNISQPESGAVAQQIVPIRSHRVSLECDSHDFMQGWVFAADNPYAAVVDSTGSFHLDGIPPGTHTLSAWHPRLGVQSAEVTVPPDGAAEMEFIFSEE